MKIAAYLVFLITTFIGINYWYKKSETRQDSVLYCTEIATKSKVKKINRHDAVVVSHPFLMDQYQKMGITTPIFFIPFDFNLGNFLKEPLKKQANPVFTFGYIASSNDVGEYINLIKTFFNTFKDRKDVFLHVHFPYKKNIKVIKRVITTLQAKNIFLSNKRMSPKREIKFFKSIDCYIHLPCEENLLGNVYKALALGIPIINDFAACNKDRFGALMLNMHQNYREYLLQANEGRKAARDFEELQQAAIKKMCQNMVCPQKLIFGNLNLVHERYLETNSPKLYEKYLSQVSVVEEVESNQMLEFLKPLHPPSAPSGIEGIDCVYVINLDERPARWERVKKEFDLQKITPYRVSAINGWEIPKKLSALFFDEDADLLNHPFGGALGCLLSHLSIYKNALERGFETIWICEDDIEFKESAETISSLIKQVTAMDAEWDILYTDYSLKGTDYQRPRPGHPFYKQVQSPMSGDLMRVHGRFNMHSMIFSKRGLKKVYEYFIHGRLWSPIDVDIHYAPGLREYSTKNDIVTSIYDSSVLALDGSSDTQSISSLNEAGEEE